MGSKLSSNIVFTMAFHYCNELHTNKVSTITFPKSLANWFYYLDEAYFHSASSRFTCNPHKFEYPHGPFWSFTVKRNKDSTLKSLRNNGDLGMDFLNEAAQWFCIILAAILMRSHQLMLHSLWRQCNKILQLFQRQQINHITSFQKYTVTVKMSYELVTNMSSLHIQLISSFNLLSLFFSFPTVWRHRDLRWWACPLCSMALSPLIASLTSEPTHPASSTRLTTPWQSPQTIFPQRYNLRCCFLPQIKHTYVPYSNVQGSLSVTLSHSY